MQKRNAGEEYGRKANYGALQEKDSRLKRG